MAETVFADKVDMLKQVIHKALIKIVVMLCGKLWIMHPQEGVGRG